jgi:RNA polymerase sigma-70 factor (ECF subfamily)
VEKASDAPDPPHLPDADLIAAFRRGDAGAFEVLYFRHKEWAYRLAWRFCADETEALDVVQETFLYLAGKFREDAFTLRAALTTLIYPAVKHTALALKRKRRRLGAGLSTARDDADIPVPAPDTPDAAAIRGELAAVLTTLGDAHREVILMRFVDDMTLEEIAEALAIPLGTAKSRLHHALAALRDDPRVRKHFTP